MGCSSSADEAMDSERPAHGTADLSSESMDELRQLGYEYRGGRLLQVGSDKGFEFRDQQHYDLLADAVLGHVGALLVGEAKLTPVVVPLGAEKGPRSSVFVSEGFQAAEKLLLIIQGSGRVRVGVWGCALCINKDLDHGTMLPYLQKAKEQNYGVIVLNPNDNSVERAPIPGSETADRHVAYVWEHFVSAQCASTATVDIVAHSNGGRALLEFLARSPAATSRIRHVVFTDSYHSPAQVSSLSAEPKALLADPSRSVNYVPHSSPLGEAVSDWVSLGYQMNQAQKGCLCLSAAVVDHAATNHAALEPAFKFFAA
mmetsp:Transcript_100564/g.181527  ORF Transcript_100564/g.181527 Transcript_100564/m.181527 type:complete len:314 (-) Transcript_100564:16-957(-)